MKCEEHRELTSDGVSIGTIQLPPDGDPILLMVDGAPTGGYPRLGHVASVDLPIVAQARPGQSFRFEAIAIEQAQQLLRCQRRRMEQIANTIRCWAEGVSR
jgi:antagonist of KipI